MQWFKNWSSEIVIGVIIVSIIEMIVPNNSSKKYIKVFSGIFIMYLIISPVISLGFSQDINSYIDNYEKGLELKNNDENLFSISTSISKVYAKNLEDDLKRKLENKGYIVGKVSFAIKDDDTYGIEKVEIELLDKTDEKKKEKKAGNVVDEIKIVLVKIGGKNSEQEKITNQDKDEVKSFVNSEYGIDSSKICI